MNTWKDAAKRKSGREERNEKKRKETRTRGSRVGGNVGEGFFLVVAVT